MQRLSKSKKPVARQAKNQLSSLVINESLNTTLPRAKMLKREAQILISNLNTMTDLLALRRKIDSKLSKLALQKAIEDRSRFESVSLYKTLRRKGDSAQMAMVKINIKNIDKKNQAAKKES